MYFISICSHRIRNDALWMKLSACDLVLWTTPEIRFKAPQ